LLLDAIRGRGFGTGGHASDEHYRAVYALDHHRCRALKRAAQHLHVAFAVREAGTKGGGKGKG
jgi:hypothetical protein